MILGIFVLWSLIVSFIPVIALIRWLKNYSNREVKILIFMGATIIVGICVLITYTNCNSFFVCQPPNR